jgi:formylglycine-generating enzyme required for sulfatase activity
VDGSLRDLERRILEGDERARDELERLWLRSGRGWHGETLPRRLEPVPEVRGLYVWRLPSGSSHELVRVPAGDFLMGTAPVEGHMAHPPTRRTISDPYWISLTQVTWKPFLEFCAHAKHEAPPEPPWGTPDDHPAVNVTWHDADDFCRWAGLALPREHEWEKAARGVDGQPYPWGHEPPSPERTVTGTHPRFGRRSTAPVSETPQNVSPFGARGMCSNVSEWCEELFSQDPRLIGNPIRSRVTRGVSWRQRDDQCAAAYRAPLTSRSRLDSVGFRAVLRGAAE